MIESETEDIGGSIVTWQPGHRKRFNIMARDKIHSMRIAIAQLDQVVGDLEGNAARIVDAVDGRQTCRRRPGRHAGTLALRISS